MSRLLVLLSSLLLLLLLLVQDARGDRLSGLYVDNGLDQTVVHRVVSQREKREVEHEILNLLGLPDRPPRHASGSPQVRRSAPKFLLDIYRNALQQQQQQQERSSEFGLSGQDLRAIDQSDVIMTFAAHNHHVPGVRHERGKRLWFDVSEVPANELLLGAELRLYRSLDSARSAKNRAAFTLTAYRVLRLEDGERELEYVDAVNASAAHEGWLSLNVSAPVRHWVREPRANRGLYLSVHPADRHVHEVKPEDIGVVGFRGAAERQPFLVGFFKSSGARPHRVAGSSVRSLHGGARSKRETKKDKPKKGGQSSSLPRPSPYGDSQLPSQGGGMSGGGGGGGGGNNTRTCKIQTLYVSFRDLQWQDWIIAPDGYDAYYCSGECNFPLNAHMNATNHAIVQTLVHLVNPGKVPKPCCAPTKLSPISVLYFLDESNVILKKYKNMVVKSCGCH